MSHISLNIGSGGADMHNFLQGFLPDFYRGDWQNSENDAATFPLPNGDTLCFTTDSFVVNPVFFPGGNIGDLAFAGTVNDLAVMGADPIGISCGAIIEEGLEDKDFRSIMESMSTLSKQYKIPVATGDTKVMEKGSLDKLVLNTAGVGIAKKVLVEPLNIGDKVILSGEIGEHGIALLSERFDFQTAIVSDTQPLVKEMSAIRDLIKCAKDPTRGGLSAAINEIAIDQNLEIALQDNLIPIKKSVRVAGELLGIDVFTLACEGRCVCFAGTDKADQVVETLKEFNPMATIIGEVAGNKAGGRVILQTDLGRRFISMPRGKIVPRIC